MAAAGIVPITKFSTNENGSECNRVIKAGTIIGGLRMYSNQNQNDYGDNEGSFQRSRINKIIERIPILALDYRDDSTKNSTDYNIKEAMHAAVESAKHDRCCVEIRENFQEKFDFRGRS